MSRQIVSDLRSKYTTARRSSAVMMSLAVAASLSVVGCGGKNEAGADGRDSAAHAAADSHSAPHSHDATAEPAGAHTHSTRLEFISAPAAVRPGEAATWTLKIVDAKTGAPVSDFSVVHEKMMHLIVISTDLSWFNHIHPEYKGNGIFTVSATLPKPGSYKLYADYTPKGATQEVAQYELATDGAPPTPASVTMTADSLNSEGWMMRQVTSAPEGEPDGSGGSAYTVALMPMPMKLTPGKDAMLHFQVRDKAGKPVTNLSPYLGAMGHLVVLSSDTKTFLHAHPMDGGMESMAGMDHSGMNHGATGGATGADSGAAPKEHAAPKIGGPDVIFHTNFPTAGRYKLWGQFLHNGKVITAPFTIDVG